MVKEKKMKSKLNVVQIIHNRYERMSATNKKIADFILHNPEKSTFYALADISREIGFSDATLIRFAKELGYSGYRGLRADLVDYIKQIIQPAHKKAFTDTKEQDSITEMVMKKDIEYISRTISKIDREALVKLIELIVSANRIFCMGWGCSAFLAEYLSYVLSIISYDARPIIRERQPMIHNSLFFKRGDILIVFDLLWPSAEVIEAVEYVHSQNKAGKVKIITITNDPRAQIVQFADLSFFCDILGHEFRLISLTAQMCFINIIVEELAARDPRATQRAFNLFQKHVQNSPLHYSKYNI